jgi:SPP1 gp7 family putative phage head morphogenesis protein
MAAAELDRMMRRRERQIAQALEKALAKIRGDIATLYDRYALNGVLTKAEMTQANRLVTAERQLVRELNTAIVDNKAVIKQLRPEQYEAAFFRYAWAIDQEAGIRLAWGRVPIRQVMRNLDNRMYHIALDRYGKDARMLIRQALNNGLVRGQSFQQMMRGIRDALNTTAARAVRIARTEGMRAANAGTVDAYTKAAELGVQGNIVWVATLDDRTRDQHADMDGVARGADGMFQMPNGEKTPAPGDPVLSAGNSINCRCTTRYEIEGYAPTLRRTREEGLIPYQTYNEWRPRRAPTL